MNRYLFVIIGLTLFLGAFPAKNASPACPTKSMYKEFFTVMASPDSGAIQALMAYPSCAIMFKGASINAVLERNWSNAKVVWTDPNGNKRIDYVTIESVRGN
jgi:hypothetical protein